MQNKTKRIRTCSRTKQLLKELKLEHFSQLNNLQERWPLKKEVYNHIVGALLPRIIGEVFQGFGLGFVPWINPTQGNDVDLKIFYEDKLVYVIEVLNWSERSRLTERRLCTILKNLFNYDCERILIYTILNEAVKSNELLHTINLVEIGYQILPYDLYTWFEKKGQSKGRRPYGSFQENFIKWELRNKLSPLIEGTYPHIGYKE